MRRILLCACSLILSGCATDATFNQRLAKFGADLQNISASGDSADNRAPYTYTLSEDLGISGVHRLCKYSDGRVYVFDPSDLCPLTAPGALPPKTSLGQEGFLLTQSIDGMDTVCTYSVNGVHQDVRHNGVATCSATYVF